MRILTIDDIQQSWVEVLLKHFTPFRQIEVPLLLSSLFQKIDEDPDNRWYTTIVYKAVTETLHGLLTNWGVAFPVISISNNRWRFRQMVIYTNRVVYKTVTETFHTVSENELSLFLSSPFQILGEDPHNWWYSTIVYKAVTKALHAFSTEWGRFSCHLYFKQSMKNLTIGDIQKSYIKLLLKHFMPSWQIEVSLFLSSPFQIFD